MALSSDPEKRARSLANLRKGPPAAAKKFELPVVGYEEPKTAPEPTAPKSSPGKKAAARPPAAEPPATPAKPSSGPPAWLVLGGGVAALLVLIIILNRTSPRGPQ